MIARRNFIKNTGATIVGAALFPSRVTANINALPSKQVIPHPDQGLLPIKISLRPDVLLDYDRRGNQYALNLRENTITKYTSGGHFLWRKGGLNVRDYKLLNGPASIDVDPSGRVYVADLGNDRVVIYSENGSLLKTIRFAHKKRMSHPRDLAVANNRIYVADTYNHQIHVYGTNGQHKLSFGSLGAGYSQLNSPTSVTVGDGSNIFVVDRGNLAIKVFDQKGILLDIFDRRKIAELASFRPSYIQIGLDGVIYALDSNSSRLAAITQEGRLLDLFYLVLSDGSKVQSRYLSSSQCGFLSVTPYSIVPRGL